MICFVSFELMPSYFNSLGFVADKKLTVVWQHFDLYRKFFFLVSKQKIFYLQASHIVDWPTSSFRSLSPFEFYRRITWIPSRNLQNYNKCKSETNADNYRDLSPQNEFIMWFYVKIINEFRRKKQRPKHVHAFTSLFIIAVVVIYRQSFTPDKKNNNS